MSNLRFLLQSSSRWWGRREEPECLEQNCSRWQYGGWRLHGSEAQQDVWSGSKRIIDDEDRRSVHSTGSSAHDAGEHLGQGESAVSAHCVGSVEEEHSGVDQQSECVEYHDDRETVVAGECRTRKVTLCCGECEAFFVLDASQLLQWMPVSSWASRRISWDACWSCSDASRRGNCLVWIERSLFRSVCSVVLLSTDCATHSVLCAVRHILYCVLCNTFCTVCCATHSGLCHLGDYCVVYCLI